MTDQFLNPVQRIAVAAALRHLENILYKAQNDIHGPDQRILTRRSISLTPKQSWEAQRLIEAMLAEVAALAVTFELPIQIEENYSDLRDALSIFWVDRYDIRAEALQRYGDVDPLLERILDPEVMQLGHFTHELTSILQTTPEMSIIRP